MDCCRAPAGIDEVFNERLARADARGFQRRGLPLRARRLVDALERRVPLDGATSLEIGGGVGGLSIELLRSGVSTGAIVDASSAYVDAARRLAAECGVADRLDVRLGNFADEPGSDTADIVVLDRVVCCFNDWKGLLDPAARKAARAVALSWPRDAFWVGLLVRTVNLSMRLLRRGFRMHHHSPFAMQAHLAGAGFSPRVEAHRGMWEIVVAVRASSPG